MAYREKISILKKNQQDEMGLVVDYPRRNKLLNSWNM